MQRLSDIFIYFLSKKAHKTKMNIATQFAFDRFHLLVEGSFKAQTPLDAKDS